MRNPNFFVIGAPKAGTTSLVNWLNCHPNVYVSPVKEPHYFNRDMGNNPIKSESEYLRLFSKAEETHSAIGEASVWYMYSEEAVPNILKKIPDAKFIVMLRDPAEMAVSLHEQLYFSGIENEKNFKTAWESIGPRRNGEKLPRLCIEPRLLDYERACAIGSQVSKLTSLIVKKNILFISFMEIKEKPRDVLRRVEEFLELSQFHYTELPVENSAKERKSRKLMLLMYQLNRVRRLLRIPRLNTGIMKRVDQYNRVYRVRQVDEKMLESLKGHFRSEKLLAEKVSGVKL